MRYKWILLMCVGVILVQVTFANTVGSSVADQDNLGEGDDTGPQKSRNHTDEPFLTDNKEHEHADLTTVGPTGETQTNKNESSDANDGPEHEGLSSTENPIGSHAYEEQVSDTNKGNRIGSSDSSIRDPNENLDSNVNDRAGLNTPENSNRTGKKKNAAALILPRTPNGNITTTEKPSTICTKSGINYDCILQNLRLSKSEDINFGLTWKSNPQKNVTIEEDSRLAYLPKKLFEAFPQMELLNAESLQIEEIEDRAFSNAKKLKYLFLKDNRITAIHGFQGVPGLIQLDVSYNRINFIHENAFKNNKRLQRILMNNNFISELPNTDMIGNLQVLNVANNKISKISEHQLSKNVNLEQLDVSYNNLSYFNLVQLDNKNKLSSIDVSHNNLKRLHIPMRVNSLKAANNSIEAVTVSQCNLEKLDLSHNQLTDVPDLQTCSKLKTLNLSYNKLQYFNLTDSFSKLFDLNLANNHLFKITFPKKFHPLQILDLSNNRLSFGPSNNFNELKRVKLNNNKFIEFKFSNMKKLNFIQMNNNEWDCKKVENIFNGNDVYVADAKEVCQESQSRNGICCKNYTRGFNDRLKEMVRETFTHENVNAQDQGKCKRAKPNTQQQQQDIKAIHAYAATLDSEKRKIYDEVQITNIKLDETNNQISLAQFKKSNLSETHENYKKNVNKLRARYGVINEGLISAKVTLDRVLKFTLERNALSKDVLARRKKEVQEKQQRFDSLTEKITDANIENDKLKEELASLKQRESAARKTKLQLEKEANRNSPSLHGSKG